MKFFKNYLNNKVVSLLKKHGFKSPILEIGCGTGETLELLRNNYNAEGIDLSEEAIKACRNKKLKVKKLDFMKNRKKYNSIICIDVIEHIADDLRFVKHINSSLNRGGKIFVLVPSGKFLKDDIKYGHFRRYSKTDVKNLLEGANFKIEHVEMFGYPFLHFARRIANLLISIKTENEDKKENTKKSSYKSPFDSSFLSKIANYLNRNKLIIKALGIQDFFNRGNKGLGVIAIAKRI